MVKKTNRKTKPLSKISKKRVPKKTEKPPLHSRRCVGCGKYDARENLIRVVKDSKTGAFAVEYNTKASETHIAGRGAYTHAQCLKRAGGGGLARALKCAVPENILNMLGNNG